MNVRAIRPLAQASHLTHIVSDRIGGHEAPPCPPAPQDRRISLPQLSEAISNGTPGPIEELSEAPFT